MKIAIPRESLAGETRVAGSPDTVGKLTALGFQVLVQKDAGVRANFTDAAFKNAGATIAKDFAATVKGAGVVLKINGPVPDEISRIAPGTLVLAHMAALSASSPVAACAKADITAFAMELMPRITRAQGMDILSSQSSLAGYRTVIDGAAAFGRAFPMMMTAAGTVAPARVFVMGVGVAGLQAIATAKRLGAVVTATDVRPATREQVESLGGKFLEVDAEMEQDAQTTGGYAKEMPPEYLEKQKAVVAEHIKKQDIVITTALIPGRPAPRLVTAAMVASMRPGSIIIDMAMEAGGNCEGAVADTAVDKNGVKIIAHTNIAARVPEDASALFAGNLLNFLSPHIDRETGKLALDWEDETVTGTLVTRDGAIVHERLKGLTSAKAKPATKAAKKKLPSKAATKARKKPAAAKPKTAKTAKPTAGKEA